MMTAAYTEQGQVWLSIWALWTMAGGFPHLGALGPTLTPR